MRDHRRLRPHSSAADVAWQSQMEGRRSWNLATRSLVEQGLVRLPALFSGRADRPDVQLARSYPPIIGRCSCRVVRCTGIGKLRSRPNGFRAPVDCIFRRPRSFLAENYQLVRGQRRRATQMKRLFPLHRVSICRSEISFSRRARAPMARSPSLRATTLSSASQNTM